MLRIVDSNGRAEVVLFDWGGVALSGRDISLDLKALVDDSIKGVMRTLGDPGAAPLNGAGGTVLYRLNQLESFQSYIRALLYAGDRAATTTPLADGATYTSTSWNMAQGALSYMTVMVRASRAGNLHIDQGSDDVNWDQTNTTAIVADTTLLVKQQLYGKYARFRVVNSAGAAQTYLRASGALVAA